MEQELDSYFKNLEADVVKVYKVAEEARSKGLDPKTEVEIPLARSLAEKVVGLISTVYKQIDDERIVKRILELEQEHGKLDAAVAFKIAEEIAKQKFCKFKNLLEAIDAGVRVGFAYITLGVVSSPIEGYTELKLKKTRDGREYFEVYFSGPIRSAGTTASCVVLMLIDYLRELFGYARYDPTEEEVRRYVSENQDYHERVTNLQYMPTEEEIVFLARNIPIQISGEPTERLEVSNYKNLERVDTNFIRGGMCLIFSEGLAQKAQKGLRLLRGVQAKGFETNGWEFLEEFLKIQAKRAKGTGDDSPVYIKDLVAGRPVFGHPSMPGGFRFRYGISRASGFSAFALHPATMAITDGFIASGTQLKIEKPTKGGIVMPCDSIEGPTVRLKNGSVKKIKSREEAENIYKEVEEIIYLGDILFPFGDLVNRNYNLLKSGYVEEWWELELQEKIRRGYTEDKEVDHERITIEEAIIFSKKFGVPLHPKFIFYWTEISKEQFLNLIDWLRASRVSNKIIFPYGKSDKEKFEGGKRALELLGVEHVVTVENVVLSKGDSKTLLTNLGIDMGVLEKENFLLTEIIEVSKFEYNEEMENPLEKVNLLSNYEIKDKAGEFIGARMGRPEKAKLRKLTGSPNALFPVGQEGGRLRSVLAACEVGKVRADTPIYYCPKCGKQTIYSLCETCAGKCERQFYSHSKRRIINEREIVGGSGERESKEERISNHSTKDIDIKHYFEDALRKVGLTVSEAPPLIKGIRGMSSEDKAVEHLGKGVLRASYNLQVNKDGTIRYDATEMPLTYFKPKEIFVGVEKLKELGYMKDIHGNELTEEDQVLELKPHDILLPSCPKSPDERADRVFLDIAGFVDSLLERFYGVTPFYNIKKREDLIGHLGVCMAPHNCAGVICRFIGFTDNQGLMASPYMHAAIRRDCLSHDNYVSVKKDGKWKIEKIGDFINKEDPKEKADIFGTLKKEMTNTFTWSNPGKSEVKEVTKHSPRKILKIGLEDGRNISLTEDHQVYVKGKMKIPARDLEAGDKLMVSYKRDIEEKDIKEFFLPEIFQNRGDVMIRNVRAYLGDLCSSGGLEPLSKKDNFYQRDSFPIKFVKSILEKNGKTLHDLPSETRISIKRDNVEIPIRIKLDESLLEIIGLYIAEGYSRIVSGKKGLSQVYIASNDEVLRGFIKETIKKHFGLNPSERKEDRVTFSSKLLYLFFIEILGCGSNAKNKRIPSVFLDLKKDKLAALLRGYFEGDGGVSLNDARVVCDSVSEGLKHDLSFVLSRFGIFTKFYEYEKQPGPKVKEFYLRKKRKVPRFKITKIIIPSNFVIKFKDIGFISERKNKILNEIFKIKPYGMRIDFDEDYIYPKIKKIEEKEEEISYCFNVFGEHNFFSNDILVKNCDGDEAALMLLGDVLINFSREFLPGHRGGTQDAPLVLNAKIDAGEVDDQILDFEITNPEESYPLELYKLAEQRKHSSEVKSIVNVKQILAERGDPFRKLGYTHKTSDINAGVLCSSYKTLATMKEKVHHQMELVEKIRAADTADTAKLIIERHFIRDMRGNLRKFSMQSFRCVGCNEILRRPPLTGVCPRCKGKIIFTIHEGGIKKYLNPAIELVNKYNLSPYIKQSLELTKRYIDSVFGRELEQQENLQKWF